MVANKCRVVHLMVSSLLFAYDVVLLILSSNNLLRVLELFTTEREVVLMSLSSSCLEALLNRIKGSWIFSDWGINLYFKQKNLNILVSCSLVVIMME